MGQILAAAFHHTLISFFADKYFEPAAFDFGKEVGEYFYRGKRCKKALEIFEQVTIGCKKTGDADDGILKGINGWKGQIYAKMGEYRCAVPLLKDECGEHWNDKAESEMQDWVAGYHNRKLAGCK